MEIKIAFIEFKFQISNNHLNNLDIDIEIETVWLAGLIIIITKFLTNEIIASKIDFVFVAFECMHIA